MKYPKKDLMNEGWTSMEALLNQEMPTDKKDYNKLLLVLLVLFAFGVGMWTGTKVTTQKATAEVTQKTMKSTPNQAVSMLSVIPKLTPNSHNSSTVANNDEAVNTSKINTKSSSSANLTQVKTQSRYNSNQALINQNQPTNSESVAIAVNQTESIQEKLYLAHAIEKTEEAYANNNISLSGLNLIGMLPSKNILSQGVPTSYLPRSSAKLRNKTNWVLGLGLNTGINVDRNTKVLSLNSDWMYKIGKQNSIGVQFLYAAEDEFGFFPNNNEEPISVSTIKPEIEEESDGRNKDPELTQNSRQYRFAAGLVIQQEVGYRFYSNFAFGIDMLQNSYSEVAQLKSHNIAKNIQYHFGGYTSFALGYRISELVDLEISATKSMLIDGPGIYKPGNSDHIVGGVKISF